MIIRLTIRELRKIIRNILIESDSPFHLGKTWFGFNFGPQGQVGASKSSKNFGGWGDMAFFSWKNPWPEKFEKEYGYSHKSDIQKIEDKIISNDDQTEIE